MRSMEGVPKARHCSTSNRFVRVTQTQKLHSFKRQASKQEDVYEFHSDSKYHDYHSIDNDIMCDLSFSGSGDSVSDMSSSTVYGLFLQRGW